MDPITMDDESMLDLGRCPHGRVNDGECVKCQDEADEQRCRWRTPHLGPRFDEDCGPGSDGYDTDGGRDDE